MKRIVIGVLFFVSFDIYAYQLVNRLQTGTIDYHLTTPGIPIGPNPNLPGQRSPANTYDANPVSIGIGTTIVSGENPFYLDIFLQTSTSAETQLNVLGYQENLSGTRSDYSIAAGYALAEAFSVFYGYKQGETDASGDKGSTAAFIARGPFLGFVYALKFQQHSISFNAAVAQLIGKIKYDINAPIVNQYSQLNSVTESIGFAYGLQWNWNLKNDLTLSLAASNYNYVFTDILDRRYGQYNGEVEEELLNIKLGIAYMFEMY